MNPVESNTNASVEDREAAEAAKRKESIKRSMSRYRNRPNRANTTAAPPVPELPRSPGVRNAHTAPHRVENPFEEPRFEERSPPRQERQLIKKAYPEKEKPDKRGFISRLFGRKSKVDGKARVNFGPGNLSRVSSSHSDSARPPSSSSVDHVRVNFQDHVTKVSVSADMKARDVMALAAEYLNIAIDLDKWTIKEFFAPLGLERPLRRYETVREVVRSWDGDQKCHLTLSLQDDNNDLEADEYVEARFSPDRQTAEISFRLYHAYPGHKFERRYITLKPEGQVTMSKKEKKPSSASDTVNICHMTDFDIFCMASREQKKVNPPKKYNFVVKTLQKLCMFENNNNNYAHYFSVKDPNVAREFYDAIHGWRSYYIINVLSVPGNEHPALLGDTIQPRPRKNTLATTYEPRLSAESEYRAVYAQPHPEMNVDLRNHPDGHVEPGVYYNPNETYTIPATLTRTVTRGSSHAAISRTNTLHRPSSSNKQPYHPSSSYPDTTFTPNSLLFNLDRHQSIARRSNTLRRPGTGTPSAPPSARASFEEAESPFVPGGLLAGLSRGGSRAGGAGRSGAMKMGMAMGMGPGGFRGEVMGGRGESAGASPFAEGSLLRDVEERERERGMGMGRGEYWGY